MLHLDKLVRLGSARRTYKEDPTPQLRKEDDVVVIGIAIKVAGADDVDEFWDLLCHGSS